MAAVMAYISPSAQRAAEAYGMLVRRMYAYGLTEDQVSTLLESDRRLVGRDSPKATAAGRLDDFAQHGYFTILLGEVLTEDELTRQIFSYGTVLNGQNWMSRPCAKYFAEAGRDRQRGLVQAAIMLATECGGEEAGWPLERAMAAVMPHVEGT